MNVILEPLRMSLRYGRNGLCFVGFRGRLTLQTPRNVEERRANELSATQKGVSCSVSSSAMGWPSSFACGARPWPTHMAELPCRGARGSARQLFFFNDTASTEIYTLSLHDALPIYVILEPLRMSLRYGRNGPCFVGFRGRLTLQTPRNVEGRRRNELSGTQKGIGRASWREGVGMSGAVASLKKKRTTHMAELPCWGARGWARQRAVA